jgi:hypothetical protein
MRVRVKARKLAGTLPDLDLARRLAGDVSRPFFQQILAGLVVDGPDRALPGLRASLSKALARMRGLRLWQRPRTDSVEQRGARSA